jgi:hypothetical protein
MRYRSAAFKGKFFYLLRSSGIRCRFRSIPYELPKLNLHKARSRRGDWKEVGVKGELEQPPELEMKAGPFLFFKM